MYTVCMVSMQVWATSLQEAGRQQSHGKRWQSPPRTQDPRQPPLPVLNALCDLKLSLHVPMGWRPAYCLGRSCYGVLLLLVALLRVKQNLIMRPPNELGLWVLWPLQLQPTTPVQAPQPISCAAVLLGSAEGSAAPVVLL